MIKHSVWPTDPPPGGVVTWLQKEWAEFESKFRPYGYDGGMYDAKAYSRFLEAKKPTKVHHFMLQRQGVYYTLHGSFSKCDHGYGWYVEARAGCIEVWYPNCNECYNFRGPAGQVAYADREASHVVDRYEIEKACMFASGLAVKISNKVEAYMCYPESDYNTYKHIENDVFIAACYYLVSSDCVVSASGVNLVAFVDHEHPQIIEPVYSSISPYANEIERAIGDLEGGAGSCEKRNGSPHRVKTWFAWLLSEYIKKEHPKAKTVILKRMII